MSKRPPPPLPPPSQAVSPPTAATPPAQTMPQARVGSSPAVPRAPSPPPTPLEPGDVLTAVDAPPSSSGSVPADGPVPHPSLYFREVLLQGACKRTGCTHAGERLDIRPECHGWAGLRALYAFDRGVLLLACGECGAEMAELPIASSMGERLPNVKLVPLAIAFPPPAPPEPPEPPPAPAPPDPGAGWWSRRKWRRKE